MLVGMKGITVKLVLIIFCLGTLFSGWPKSAEAANDITFQADSSVIKVARTSNDTLTATFVMHPNNGWQLTGPAAVKFTFKKGGIIPGSPAARREWVLNSASPTKIKLTKPSTDEEWTFDYSGTNTSADESICFVVDETGAPRANMSHKNDQCRQLPPPEIGSNENTTPLWALGYSINKSQATVENYGGDFGSVAGLDTVGGWFGYNDGQTGPDISDLHLTISKNKGKAPYLLVPKAKLSNPPGDIKFVLVAYHGLLGNLKSDEDWFMFQGMVDGKPVDNLYFGLTDNKDMNFYYVTDLAAFKNHDLTDATAKEIARANETSLVDDLYSLLGMVANYPTGSGSNTDGNTNCGQGIVLSKKIENTGPNGLADNKRETIIGLTVESNGQPLDPDQTPKMSANCANISGTGWLQYWGVTDLAVDQSIDESLLGGCSFGALTAKGDIGSIFGKILECLFASIFEPMVNWAAGQVEYASGLSWLAPTERYYLIRVSWT